MTSLVARWHLLGKVLADPRLSRGDAATTWALLEMYSERNGGSWPSYETLAQRVGVHRRSVIRSVERLVGAGYFERGGGGGRGKANVYRPRLQTVTERPPFGPAKCDSRATVSKPERVTAASPTSDSAVTVSPDKGCQPCHPNPLKKEITLLRNPTLTSDHLLVEHDSKLVESMVLSWNETARRCSLSIVQKVTPKRRREALKRLAEVGGLDGWRAALEKVEASAFLTGRNGTAWRADFDFVLREDKLTRLMEGAYDGSAPGHPQRKAGRDDLRDAIARRRDRPLTEGGER